jgi:hypothetical protein
MCVGRTLVCLPLCECAARILRAVCVLWGRPAAEPRAGVRWAKLPGGLVA